MNIRKIASLTALISFVLEIVTSVILYIVPQGRVAYWSDWHLWGLSKTQWGDLHVNLGVLFLLAILLHTYYNWPLVIKYLTTKTKQFSVFTINFNIALLLTLSFTIGTYLNIAPFSSFLNMSDSIKDRASATYGEPPYGHAELSSLKILCKRVDIDPSKSLERLRAAGIKVTDTNQTILEIATANKLSPKEVYMVIAPVPETILGNKALPPSPGGGFGKKPIGEICLEYGLNCEEIIDKLTAEGFSATKEMSIKDIGAQYQRNPHDIYDILREK